MIRIELTDEQIEALTPEIKRTEEAHRVGREGMLVLQVWPNTGMAEGRFIPEAAAEEIVKITRKYHV